ncbi:hypothetical protein LDC_0121 [sediment metagenome]|uniref:AlwI restriction endonuclease n=1 Tax=sediment metagenome TaxID=749907 RepID=D9PF43_9ZZZZ
MSYDQNKIKFQTYSWVYGTTSFRVSELKYKIEKQLLLVEDLRTLYPESDWKELQSVYFDLLVEAELSKDSAKEIEKDARQKTSSLKDLGLVTEDRKMTSIGKLILETTLDRDNIKFDNVFSLRGDSYLYFKQFLKIEFSKNSDSSYNSFLINPFFALIYSIVKLGSVSNDFFNLLLPIQKDFIELKGLIDSFIANDGSLDIQQILLDKISSMENYQNALNYFLENAKDEENFKTVFMNMKGGKFDLPYKDFYELITSYITSDPMEIKLERLKSLADYISDDLSASLLKKKYYKLLFDLDNKPKKADFKEELIIAFESSFLYRNANFDENFFYLVHLVKWYTNLEKEYSDNNKRFLALTDSLIFEDDNIKLNPIIKVYFDDIIDSLVDNYVLQDKEEYQRKLHHNIELSEINLILEKDIKLFAEQLLSLYPTLDVSRNIQEQIFYFSKNDKLQRFNQLIDTHFSTTSLSELFAHIVAREDDKILNYQNINWDANIPTIFEYLTGIAWYLITNKQSDIADFLNMSLDSNLLPLRFAGGGQSDIICKYSDEDILIEVTLSNDENQRRMELEPVSRHLGRYRLAGNNAYAIFVAPYLDPNVLVGFRSYKYLNYYDRKDTSNFVSGLKIIPLTVEDIKFILENNLKYEKLKSCFENLYQDDEKDGFQWYNNVVNPKIRLLCS